jgi:putative transposase
MSDHTPLKARIQEIANVRIRYGYLRIHALLRREGWQVNLKRVYRLSREMGLSLRIKRPRRHWTAKRRLEREVPPRPNQVWSMDCVSDASIRECPAIEADQGIKGEQVATVMERLRLKRFAPAAIRGDNGLESIIKVLDAWAYQSGVTLDLSRPGKPTANAYIE